MTHPTDFDFTGLSAPERLLLAQQLLDSVLVESTPLTPQQLAEMTRRSDAMDRGEVQGVPWETVRARLTAGT